MRAETTEPDGLSAHDAARAADSDREAFRKIFHLFFQAGRQDLARAVRKAQRLLESVSDPALRGKARRYVRALDSERKAGAA